MESSTKREKKTPPNVVKLIKKEVSRLGQNKAAQAMSLPLFSLQKYMTGKTEPTQASLQKIASYFNTSVAWLRGDLLATEDGRLDFNKVNPGRFLLRDLKTIQDVIEGTCSKETRREVIEQYAFPSLQRTWEIYRRDWSGLNEDERAAIREAFPIMLALGVPIDWTPPADHDDK